jgi:hypothetical protein
VVANADAYLVAPASANTIALAADATDADHVVPSPARRPGWSPAMNDWMFCDAATVQPGGIPAARHGDRAGRGRTAPRARGGRLLNRERAGRRAGRARPDRPWDGPACLSRPAAPASRSTRSASSAIVLRRRGRPLGARRPPWRRGHPGRGQRLDGRRCPAYDGSMSRLRPSWPAPRAGVDSTDVLVMVAAPDFRRGAAGEKIHRGWQRRVELDLEALRILASLSAAARDRRSSARRRDRREPVARPREARAKGRRRDRPQRRLALRNRLREHR